MTEIHVIATLREAIWSPDHNKRIIGTIFGHKNARFGDGDVVTTSPVVEELGDGLYKTKSGTIYKVEWQVKEELPLRFYRVVKGQDAYVEYTAVVEAHSEKEARSIASNWQFDGAWHPNGVIDEYDHFDVFEDRTEVVEAETLEEAQAQVAKDYPELLTLRITEPERDMILAGLRLWQANDVIDTEIMEIAKNGRPTHLTNEEIDALCERINLG